MKLKLTDSTSSRDPPLSDPHSPRDSFLPHATMPGLYHGPRDPNPGAHDCGAKMQTMGAILLALHLLAYYTVSLHATTSGYLH